MAIKINTPLNTIDGGTIETGSIAVAQTIFMPPKNVGGSIKREVHFNIKVYRSLQAYIDGIQNVKINSFPMGYEKTMTDEEFTSLNTDIKILEKVENWLKEFIESKIGIGTCELINIEI